MRVRRAVWQIAAAAVFTVLGGVGSVARAGTAIDPYSLAPVQAACGEAGVSAPQTISGGHVAAAALEQGKARVYVITETRGIFGSRGRPVRLGIDGRWFGTSQSTMYGYSFVDVSPGVHHLCVAAKVGGLLPHSSNVVVLARVNAAAGQTYYFYNRWLVGLLTLDPLNTDEGAMEVEALPSSGVPKLWQTSAAQAACGADANKMPEGPVAPPTLPGPAAAGQAMVYFFVGVPKFGRHRSQVHVGMDGGWVGETQNRSYIAIPVAPGVHRLCSATKWAMGLEPVLHLGELDVAAGKTYFVNAITLQPVERSLATMWLRRIAAMPKTDTPDMAALRQWSKTNFPASADELRACGLPTPDSTATPPTMAQPSNGATTPPQVVFLLKSNVRPLAPRDALNVGLDGRWVVSLRRTSWVSVPVAAGRHDVCVQIGSPGRRNSLRIAPDISLYLDFVNAVDGANNYFESTLTSDESGIFYQIFRLDPDEGAMLVAYYPRVDTLHP